MPSEFELRITPVVEVTRAAERARLRGELEQTQAAHLLEVPE
ncbi:MAG: hypothetical protein R3B90_06285 [Planctomycetaceae bacterium]